MPPTSPWTPSSRTLHATAACRHRANSLARALRGSKWAGENWCERQVNAIFRERYGWWTTGWNWTGPSGGVVGAWFLSSQSVTTPEETASRAVAALLEWRAWLEYLAERFAELAPPPDATPEERSWHLERAAVRLVTAVLHLTGAESGWYGQCHLALEWFLTSTGMPLDEARAAVTAAVGGRFKSWTGPGRELIESVGEDLAVTLTGHLPYRDHREYGDLERIHDHT
ncbi:hypothetical protein [Streptomyces sp. NPDC006463]|uniref:hypothetical protein n=1 Tax=Streptomyces sp. NPDC006463 TaxID=3364746 RepID=UPI0036D0800C